MTYHIARIEQDADGVWRDTFTRDVGAAEIATLDLRTFQGAADLPNGVEFARGFDAAGEPIRVYRCA